MQSEETAAGAAPSTKPVPKLRVLEEYQNLAARLSDQDFQALADSIREIGQQVPGVVNQDGVILDGHHRYQACQKVGVPFSYEIRASKDKADEILLIIELNGNRRHMTAFQRAEFALSAKAELAKLAKQNMSLGGKGVKVQTPLGRVDQKLASKAHTTRDTIRKVDYVIEAVKANPDMKLEEPHNITNHSRNGATYTDLLIDARSGKIKPSKVYNILKHEKEIIRKRAETEAFARDHKLTEKVSLLNADSTKELPQIQDSSVDLILTDPPYAKQSLALYDSLAKLACAKLKEGGSLVFYYGEEQEPEIHEIFRKYKEQLTWWWALNVKYEGHKKRRIHPKGVWVVCKRMMWFVKGKDKLFEYDIHNFIQSAKPDKDKHPWAQSCVEAEYIVKNMTVSVDSLVVDPFLGSGAFAIPAIKLGRYFIGIELDKETLDRATSYIAQETAFGA